MYVAIETSYQLLGENKAYGYSSTTTSSMEVAISMLRTNQRAAGSLHNEASPPRCENVTSRLVHVGSTSHERRFLHQPGAVLRIPSSFRQFL